MGSLKRGRAAPQLQRLQQGSIKGDAGCPSFLDRLDALPSPVHSNDPARW